MTEFVALDGTLICADSEEEFLKHLTSEIPEHHFLHIVRSETRNFCVVNIGWGKRLCALLFVLDGDVDNYRFRNRRLSDYNRWRIHNQVVECPELTLNDLDVDCFSVLAETIPQDISVEDLLIRYIDWKWEWPIETLMRSNPSLNMQCYIFHKCAEVPNKYETNMLDKLIQVCVDRGMEPSELLTQVISKFAWQKKLFFMERLDKLLK